MFTTKPRPVPSKAALRVLYQLAYISSGTAVGVGILCAEERRRRTQIVQRIADNAKRIRQHPRYVANATALAVRDGADDTVNEWHEGGVKGGGGYGTEDQGAQNRNLKTRRRGKDHDWRNAYQEEAVKGKELPSVIEREYNVVAAGMGKRRLTPDLQHSYVPMHALSDREHGKGHGRAAQRQPRQRPLEDAGKNSTYHPVQSVNFASSRKDARPSGGSLDANESWNNSSLHFGSTSIDWRPASLQTTGTAQLRLGQHRCQALLNQGYVSAAIHSYIQSGPNSLRSQPERGLLEQLFGAALNEKLFGHCAALMRLVWEKKKSLGSWPTDLIRACGHDSEYTVLLDLFLRQNPVCTQHDLSTLPEEARAILALACTTDDLLFPHFENLYRSLNHISRMAVDKRRCHMLLRVTWRSTKNLDAVVSQKDAMESHFKGIGNVRGLRHLDRTMSEVYISANRITEALNVIARVHDVQPSDIRCFALAALALAKRQAWDQIMEILQIAASAQSPRRHLVDSRELDRLVSAYSRHHSASQTWRFVTYLQDQFRYRPGDWAKRTVLRAFVATKAINLIPRWLHRLKVAGHAFEIDAKTAAELLNQYYTDHQPSHVLIMWFCRNLTHLVPSFRPSEFETLIKRSIGNDLGGLFERNAVWQQGHAQERLERMATFADQIPSPGHKYNRQLNFHHPAANGTLHEKDETSDKKTAVGSDEGEVSSPLTPERLKSPWEPGTKETKMHIAFSCHQYETVLDLYVQCLDAAGLPSSLKALNFAVRASLRLHGHDRHAVELIKQAEMAGMSVFIALVPLLIHEMRNFDPADLNAAERLRDRVVRYYQLSADKGLDPTLHVGVTAANLLVTHGRPSYGVNVLRSILKSPRTEPRAVGIVFLTVLVKGYIALDSVHDVMHWTREVLRRDITISPTFVKELKRGLKVIRSSTRRERADLAAYVELCRTRRFEQRHKAKLLGKQLVATIAGCKRAQTTIDIDTRAELDRQMFGATHGQTDHETAQDAEEGEAAQEETEQLEYRQGQQSDKGQEAHEDARTAEARPLTRRQRILERNKQRIAESIRWDSDAAFSDDIRNARYMTNVQWQRQYRAFLRQPMVLEEDGKYAPFRYYLPSESKQWRAKEQVRRSKLKARREAFWDVAAR